MRNKEIGNKLLSCGCNLHWYEDKRKDYENNSGALVKVEDSCSKPNHLADIVAAVPPNCYVIR